MRRVEPDSSGGFHAIAVLALCVPGAALYANARFNLAVLLETQGRIAEAMQHYATALQMNPGDAEVRDRIAALNRRTRGVLDPDPPWLLSANRPVAPDPRPTMRKWFLRLLIPIAIAAAIFLFTVYRDDPIAVRVAPVERAVVEATITNSKAGTIRARSRARLSAEVGARVVAIAKREGAWVKEGEEIVRLNDASPNAQLLLARESLRVAEAALREARVARDRALRELSRKRALAQENIMSADVLDALESAHDAADAAVIAAAAERDKARAAIAAAEADLAKFSIRAPFAGVIAELSAEVGEWITPSPPLLTVPAVVDLIDPSSLYVSAPMDEVDSASIRVGQPAKVTVDSQPGRVFSGRVVRVAPYVLDVEAQNRTVEVEVEFEDGLAATLLPGTSADIEVTLEVRTDVLRIPTSALLEGRAVLIPSDGKLAEQKVEVGLKNWDWAEITDGLEEGQRVVISLDRAEVKAGARVEVEATTVRP